MKSIFACLIFIFCVKSAYCQNVTVGPSAKPLRVSPSKEKTEGSPYFNDAYSESNIKTQGKKEFSLQQVRYNLYNQQLEYTDRQNDVYAIQDSVTAFSLLDTGKRSHSFKKEKSLGFVEAVFEGRVGLLKKYDTKKEVVEDFYTKKKTNKWIPQNIYYTVKGNEIQQFQPTSKGIAKALSDKKDKVLEYIKTEQPDLGTDAGLIAVFKFYNGLD